MTNLEYLKSLDSRREFIEIIGTDCSRCTNAPKCRNGADYSECFAGCMEWLNREHEISGTKDTGELQELRGKRMLNAFARAVISDRAYPGKTGFEAITDADRISNVTDSELKEVISNEE